MIDDVLRQFSRFRRRHLWVRGLDLFLEAAFVMTITAGAMLLIDRVAFELGVMEPHLSTPDRVTVILGGTLALAALLAGALLLLRPTPPAELAWRLDRAAGGEERFLSALEVAATGDAGPFSGALCRDAVRVAQATSPRRVLPRLPVGYRWGILLSLATGTLLHAWPPHLYDAPVAGLFAAPLRGPAPLEVEFLDASTGAIDEFAWDFGDGRAGSGERVTHVYEVAGRYTARLTLRGPGGESRKAVEVEVLPSDRAVADFNADPRKGRIPLEVRFANLSKNAARFEWDFGDGATSTEPAPVHTYAKPGLYTVRLRAANEVSSDEQARPGYIKASHPDEPLAAFRGMPREGNAPLEVGFEDLSTGALAEWHWDFGDPRAGADAPRRERNPVYVYRAPGRYTVKLTVRGPHGEDVEEKVRYVHVKDDGQGPGGGGAKSPKPPPDPRRNPGGAGDKEGKLFGDKQERPPVNTVLEQVRHSNPGGETAVKDVTIFGENPEGTGKPEQMPLETLLPKYRRAAEDSIERERIPPALRNAVRRYYEALRSK